MFVKCNNVKTFWEKHHVQTSFQHHHEGLSFKEMEQGPVGLLGNGRQPGGDGTTPVFAKVTPMADSKWRNDFPASRIHGPVTRDMKNDRRDWTMEEVVVPWWDMMFIFVFFCP